MHQLKKLADQAWNLVGMAASFFAFLRDYDGDEWETPDDPFLSENRSDPGFPR